MSDLEEHPDEKLETVELTDEHRAKFLGVPVEHLPVRSEDLPEDEALRLTFLGQRPGGHAHRP